MKLLSAITDWLFSVQDSLIGSFIYLLYNMLFLNKPLVKSITGFFIGSTISIYATPVLVNVTSLNDSFLAFSSGFVGMKITETVLGIDYKEILKEWLEEQVGLNDKEKNNQQSENKKITND
jgi:hypothetical protein